jgi:PAS domain S-box-containing protein
MTHVLIVDDLEESRYLLKALLEGNGYRVTAVHDGMEALASVRGEVPDVIVSDALMPNMDGFVLCHEWMRDARLRAIPFIFYSATYATPESEKLARELGAARYLIKPQEPDAFLAELTKVLREWSGRPEPVAATLEESAFHVLHKRVLAEKLEDKLAQLENTNRQLRASEARYHTLFECAPDGIVIFAGDPESHLIDVNTSLCQMLGYTRDELITLRPADIVAETEIEQIVPSISVIKAKAPYYREWRFKRKDGSGVTAEVVATAMPDGNLLALIRDITERMHREEELHRLNRTLTLIRGCHQVLVYAAD